MNTEISSCREGVMRGNFPVGCHFMGIYLYMTEYDVQTCRKKGGLWV